MMKLLFWTLVILLGCKLPIGVTSGRNKRQFPMSVDFGVATSAYQVEGAWNEDGRSPSIWDYHTHRNNNLVIDKSNGDVAADTYHRMKSQDVSLLKDLSVDFYRFSLSWSRILPTGFINNVNLKGVNYYNSLIDLLLAKGITPHVTIYHWDLPQTLQDLGGWTNPLMADYFAAYAKKCFELFGDRVKIWFTINEPRQICEFGYSSGIFAPFLKMDGIAGYLCAKTILLAHAKAYRIYDSEYRTKDAMIGIAIESGWFFAKNPTSPTDLDAAERKLQFNFALYAHPIFSKDGNWPKVVRNNIEINSRDEGFPSSRLPAFTEEEKGMLLGSSDFLGFNHYSSFLCREPEPNEIDHRPAYDADINAICTNEPTSETTAAERFTVVPEGFYHILMWISKEYGNPKIIIGENGYAGFPTDGLNDCRRISYYNQYLGEVLKAIDDNVQIIGFTAWSFLDNFEWTLGYTVKFGLYHVDYDSPTRTRTAKMSAHVVDSRARTAADGNHLQQAQRQLEVFQSHHQHQNGTTGSGTSNGSTTSRLQVIKTQTAVVSSSRCSQQTARIAGKTSSVRSTTTTTSAGGGGGAVNGSGGTDAILHGFDSLELALNPLDLSSQKSKASVGRSVGRRPPSRSRLKEDATITAANTSAIGRHQSNTAAAATAAAAAAAAFRIQTSTAATNLHRVSRLCHQIHDTALKTIGGKSALLLTDGPREDGDGSIEITEIESSSETASNTTRKSSLSRTKSTSSEDLHEKAIRSTEDLEDLEQLQNWRRTSKLRRSLQYPNRQPKSTSSKPLDLPENKGNVRKIREDLETGRRLSTALRGNNLDLDALDQILQSISSSSSVQSDLPERDSDLIVAKKTKKSSFVTVESIKDMRSRLRRTSSPILPDKEDTDDGIVTEELAKPSDLIAAMEGAQSRVRSYVYGMESMLGKGKNISGTGSLESRTKQLNGNSALRNEDWYSRRKSYGFEQVHDNAEDENSIAHKTKNRVESSTDSGICRSTEIVVVPAATKVSCDSNSSESDFDFSFNKNRKYNSYAKLEKKDADGGMDLDDNPFSSKKATEELANIWNKRASSIGRDTYSSNSPTSDSSLLPTKLRSDSSSWMNSDSERETKSTNGINDDFKYNFTNSKLSELTDDDILANKKNNKKVEFCKTEVHFVADSGRVNIVETDEKPPPTQNFRRRRRNTGAINLDELKRTGVPVLRFGDSTYEKTLFGDPEDTQIENNSADEGVYENVQLKSEPSLRSGVVTVNINAPKYDQEEDQKENYENGTPRGILKNKPIKPKPYILGDSMLTLNENPVQSWTETIRNNTEAPIWRSTVTVRNTFYDKSGNSSDNNDISSDNERSDYGKTLRQNLRPTNGTIELKRNSDNFDLLRGRHSPVDLRRSSWSVADRVKKVEDLQWTENKGYSTKINIGNGEATVVENRHPTWPRRDEDMKRSVLSKGLVVRIGKTEQNANHVICSKTTMNPHQNGTTTTTKITIDLTPSPIDAQLGGFPTIPTIHKFPNHMPSSFKSPSLIMNTIKTEFHSNSTLMSDRSSSSSSKVKIPQQLEALRRLYEDVQSDSEADKEVQSLMSKNLDAEKEGDSSSIVSGSWSKVTAFKHLNHFNNYTAISALTQNAHLEKEQNFIKLTPEKDVLSDSEVRSKISTDKSFSPLINRRSSPIVNNQLRPLNSKELLSSPELVQPSQFKRENYLASENKSINKQMTDKRTATKSVEVLRQPKKSQMAYFGVDVSPNTLRKNKANTAASQITKLCDKPDLLQFSSKVDNNYSSNSYNKRIVPSKINNGHIYENLSTKKYQPVKREFDSKILEELTKAADEILQAVNGYTDEDRYNRFSTEEEDARKFNPETLETISETKSVQSKSQHHLKSTTASRLKQASSTSSIDSISRECLNTIHTPRSKSSSVNSTTTKSVDHRSSKKSPSSVSSDMGNKSQTKARRLQRASSREALLQSHGSSSEDLAIDVEMPVRKPRLVKRTKTIQLTINNGIDIKKPSPVEKKKEPTRRRVDERVPMGVPEIRHKTAVSTIRSTAEKVAASRERAKLRSEDSKKKTSSSTSKRDHIKGAVSSTRGPPTVDHQQQHQQQHLPRPSGTARPASREYPTAHTPTATPYRTVTSSSASCAAFVKKPHKMV